MICVISVRDWVPLWGFAHVLMMLLELFILLHPIPPPQHSVAQHARPILIPMQPVVGPTLHLCSKDSPLNMRVGACAHVAPPNSRETHEDPNTPTCRLAVSHPGLTHRLPFLRNRNLLATTQLMTTTGNGRPRQAKPLRYPPPLPILTLCPFHPSLWVQVDDEVPKWCVGGQHSKIMGKGVGKSKSL